MSLLRDALTLFLAAWILTTAAVYEIGKRNCRIAHGTPCKWTVVPITDEGTPQ